LHHNNKHLDGLVKPKMIASVLIEFKRLHWQYIFCPMTHMIFPGGQLCQGVLGLMSGPLIVSARPKIDT